jgi:hypothetical protein
VNWFQNLEQNEGSKCKIEGQGADLYLDFKLQGPQCKVCKELDCELVSREVRGLIAKC